MILAVYVLDNDPCKVQLFLCVKEIHKHISQILQLFHLQYRHLQVDMDPDIVATIEVKIMNAEMSVSKVDILLFDQAAAFTKEVRAIFNREKLSSKQFRFFEKVHSTSISIQGESLIS